MRHELEKKLKQWAEPPSKTERERCANALSIVRNSLDGFSKTEVTVFAQGSYRNGTNFRGESDVDVGVLAPDLFFYNLPQGSTKADFGIVDATYSHAELKDDVCTALRDHLKPGAVRRGNKAIEVSETTYHVEADVAVFLRHRRYASEGSFISGVEMRADDGTQIINWPDQHYDNGVAKNEATGGRYKEVVRSLKGVNSELPNPISTFLIECLAWNVPDELLNAGSLSDVVRKALTFLYQELGNDSSDEWGEVSELKYLFRASQKWTKAQARTFVVDAWNYLKS